MSKLQILLYFLAYIAGIMTGVFTPIVQAFGEYVYITLFARWIPQIEFEVKEYKNKTGISHTFYRGYYELIIRNKYHTNMLESIVVIPPDTKRKIIPVFTSKCSDSFSGSYEILIDPLPIKMEVNATIKLHCIIDIKFKEAILNYPDLLPKLQFIAQDYFKNKYIANYSLNFKHFAEE